MLGVLIVLESFLQFLYILRLSWSRIYYHTPNTEAWQISGFANPPPNFPSEMGDALPAIELGPGRTALSIVYGSDHVIVVLDNGDMKGFGNALTPPGRMDLSPQYCLPGCGYIIDLRDLPTIEFDYGTYNDF